MASKGAWVAEKTVFENNGFKLIEKKGRFELLSKKWSEYAQGPKPIDWTANQKQYKREEFSVFRPMSLA